METDELKFYNFEDYTKFLGFYYFLRKEFPFNVKDYENIKCNWGTIIIPKKGIDETIQNKISDIEDKPLEEIVMLYQLSYEYKGSIGLINKEISLSFRYDKQYKYGDINKSIEEVCYYIKEHSKRLNDFYIIYSDYIHEFLSYFVINNQYGLGREYIDNSPVENLGFLKQEEDDCGNEKAEKERG